MGILQGARCEQIVQDRSTAGARAFRQLKQAKRVGAMAHGGARLQSNEPDSEIARSLGIAQRRQTLWVREEPKGLDRQQSVAQIGGTHLALQSSVETYLA